jgi:hypothetical protein
MRAIGPAVARLVEEKLSMYRGNVRADGNGFFEGTLTGRDLVVDERAWELGWIGFRYPLHYKSSTEVYIYGVDATGWLPVGTKIKFVQSGTKYFYVVGTSYASTTTTVTLTGGSDYAVANASISQAYFSYGAAPGHPEWFDWKPTYGALGSMTYTSVSTTKAKFRISGREVKMEIQASGTAGGTASYGVTFSPPVTLASANAATGGRILEGGAFHSCWAKVINTTTIQVSRYDTANLTLGTVAFYLALAFEI